MASIAAQQRQTDYENRVQELEKKLTAALDRIDKAEREIAGLKLRLGKTLKAAA